MKNDRFKFRVYDTQLKKYLQSEKIFKALSMHISDSECGDRYIIEQCTGLKDEKGALIYEGDILLFDPVNAKMKVKWINNTWNIHKKAAEMQEIIGHIHEEN